MFITFFRHIIFCSHRRMSSIPQIYSTPTWRPRPCPSDWSKFVSECEHNYKNECGTLNRIFLDADSKRIEHFEKTTLPFLWNYASKIGELFPDGIMRLMPLQDPTSSNESVGLSRGQICCLLANMLLGETHVDGGIHYWANFALWLCHGDDFSYYKEDPRLAYANSLLLYFDWIASNAPINPSLMNEKVIFERVAVHEPMENIVNEESWGKVVLDVDCVTFHGLGSIGDNPGKEVELDFANKYIGFGQTATQEEIIFGCSPELCVAPLFIPVLGDREAVNIKGAYKICDSKGYGTQLVCFQRQQDYDVNNRIILCIDALDLGALLENEFDELSLLKIQIQCDVFDRELIKLYCGFKSMPSDLPIGTGKWGCGVFGGNVMLKLLLQVMAVSLCGKGQRLNYYKFGNEEMISKAQKLLDSVRGWTLTQLYSFITKSQVTTVASFLEL